MPALLNEDRLRLVVRDWARESGRRLAARRSSAPFRWSQQQLAELTGVTVGTISKAELGVIIPKDSVRMAIAVALLCEVDDIWPYPERSLVLGLARETVAA